MKKNESIRQSQYIAKVDMHTPPQSKFVVQPTYPLNSLKAPLSNQVCTQQPTPAISEAELTSVSPQPAASYPIGFTSSSSVLPDDDKAAINPPNYNAYTGKHGPDGSTDNHSKFLPPDHASAVSSSGSVPVHLTANI